MKKKKLCLYPYEFPILPLRFQTKVTLWLVCAAVSLFRRSNLDSCTVTILRPTSTSLGKAVTAPHLSAPLPWAGFQFSPPVFRDPVPQKYLFHKYQETGNFYLGFLRIRP